MFIKKHIRLATVKPRQSTTPRLRWY